MLESHLCFYASGAFAAATFLMTFIWWIRDHEPQGIWASVQTQYLAWTYIWFAMGLIFTASGS